MSHILNSLLIALFLTQAPKSDETAKSQGAAPKKEPTAVKSDKVEKKDDKSPAAKPPESDADKFVRESADKIEKLDHIAAQMRQTIHYPDQDIITTGTYKRGPSHRGRIELDVRSAEAVGKRIQVCDGKVAFIYEKLLDKEEVRKLDIRQILAAIERKDVPNDLRTAFTAQLPLVRPADMLRGYLNTVTFTEKKSQELGKRKAVVVEGHWKNEALQSLTGRPNATINDLPGLTPQRVRVFFDEDTRWPLRVELFRRDAQALYKPIYILEFPDLQIGKPVPEKDFLFEVPTHLVALDLTPTILAQIKNTASAYNAQQSKAADAAKAPTPKPAP